MAEKFGQRIRRSRTAKNIGLRELAKKVGISATYLSRIETMEEKSPPAEKVIKAIAKEIGDDFDVLMRLAGRIPQDVEKVIKNDPGMPEFLRTARRKGLSADDMMKKFLGDDPPSEGKKKGGR